MWERERESVCVCVWVCVLSAFDADNPRKEDKNLTVPAPVFNQGYEPELRFETISDRH